MTGRRRSLTLAGLLLLAIMVGAWVVPLHSASGVIDTTRNQCPSLPPVSKRYHLLLGQLHDYRLVRTHLVPTATADTDCGQRARLQLYL